jgi:hypothetical protein
LQNQNRKKIFVVGMFSTFFQFHQTPVDRYPMNPTASMSDTSIMGSMEISSLPTRFVSPRYPSFRRNDLGPMEAIMDILTCAAGSRSQQRRMFYPASQATGSAGRLQVIVHEAT